MPSDRRPNLFLVGAQKCGTSALAGWLGQHPEVFMSFPKEPGYLAFGEAGYPYLDGHGHPSPASQWVVRSEAEYLKLFAAATQRIIGEASTWYLARPGTAQAITRFSPDARVIVMLRDPVQRAYSAWCHARSDLLEPCETFATALAAEAQRGDVEFLLRYRQMGLYSEALAHYQATFDPDRLLVLFHEDLRSEPLSTWRTVADFLGIRHEPLPAFEHRYNTSGQPRSALVQRVLNSHRLKGIVRRVLPHNVAMRIKAGVDARNLEQLPPLDAASSAELAAFFRDDAARVAMLTGRNLDNWLQ